MRALGESTGRNALSPVEAAGFLALEAGHLDERRWDEWLELYTQDAVFWMPAWKSEDGVTVDPACELSLLYYEGRQRLAERVWRIRSGQSPASVPLQRTMHTISNVLLAHADAGRAAIRSNWTVHCYDPKRRTQHVYFGFYRHELLRAGASWAIARKEITLLNDYIPGVLDFYAV